MLQMRFPSHYPSLWQWQIYFMKCSHIHLCFACGWMCLMLSIYSCCHCTFGLGKQTDDWVLLIVSFSKQVLMFHSFCISSAELKQHLKYMHCLSKLPSSSKMQIREGTICDHTSKIFVQVTVSLCDMRDQSLHLSCIQWSDIGFGLLSGFIGHFQIITRSNYSTITNSSWFTTAHSKYFQSSLFFTWKWIWFWCNRSATNHTFWICQILEKIGV
jgi:hypothetical protein